MFWHLEGKKNWRYNVMVMSMTALAHLITLLSANDSKLMMCWQLGPYIHQGNGDRAVKVQSEYKILKVLTFSLRPED